jgi:hypothetical protein
MSESARGDIATLNSFIRVEDKVRFLLEIFRERGPDYAVHVFCAYAEHSPHALQVYARFVVGVAGVEARSLYHDAVRVEAVLSRMADVVERRRG